MIAQLWIVLTLNVLSSSLVGGATVKPSFKWNIGGGLYSNGFNDVPQSRFSFSFPQIIIVGAGASGISAAAKLLENGFNNVMILEAENRIGGRVHSIPFGKGYIDLGAQWCEGQGGNVVYELVNNDFEFGDNAIRYNNSHCYTSDGRLVDQNQYTKLMTLSDSIMTDYESMTQFNKSFGEFFEINYRKGLQDKKFGDIDEELAAQIQDFSERGMNILHASDTWFNISAKLFGHAPIHGNTQLTWKEHGYKKIFDYITKKLPDPRNAIQLEGKVHLNKEVTNIDWTSNEVIVGCLDGSEYRADHVIVTVSLGFLKERYHTLFTPQLPAKKINAIENTGFGTLGKIFLEFEEPFWSTDIDTWAAYVLLWKKEDKEKLTGTEREWLTGIDRFIRVDTHPNLISALTAGKSIKQFEEISNKKLIDDCMWLLEKFLGRPLPRPINMRRSHWMTNKYFLGSYSYPSMDAQVLNVQLAKDLAETLYRQEKKPVLLIAGEASDELNSGYVHGAVASGWRAANEILDYYNAIQQ